jgi:dissimilatory sulfite reductase (desulfoviridin) alpha/beta subunit
MSWKMAHGPALLVVSRTRKGYWKGGTVSVYGYGGGIIPRFSEVGDQFVESKEFHTIRVQPPAGNYYTTDMLRQLGDSWEKYGSGLVTFHGQTGNIMFIGTTTENIQHFFDEISAVPALAYVQVCHVSVWHAVKCLCATSRQFIVT